MKILFVTPGTEADGTTSQLALLTRELPRERFEIHVCVLGTGEGLPPFLQTAGVPLTALGWTRWLDPRPLWELRRLLRDFRPDLVHAFRPSSLRALALAGGTEGRLVVSRPFATRSRRAGGIARLDRWLLRRADRVVVEGTAAADRCLRAGLADEKVVVVPPGVTAAHGTAAPSPLPEDAAPCRALLCAGRLEAHKGFRDAIWAFDVLRYLHDDLHLLLAGDGPERPRLERFTGRIRAVGRVHFAGMRPDVPALMGAAEIVWVPSLADGGALVALEAMAAGRPVVASRLPGLAEVVADGETGFLVPPGDRIALARQTRLLLDDEALRRHLGRAGRERVARHFAPQSAVRRLAEVYAGLAA